MVQRRSYGLCWSLVRSFVHTYLKQDGTPFTAAADYAVKSFAEEMEGRDLRLEQTVRGRNFLWDGKTAVADIKNLSLTGYQVTSIRSTNRSTTAVRRTSTAFR